MNIPSYFETMRDYRVVGRCSHRLGDILGLILCGSLADCDDFSEIEDYGKDNIDFLRRDLGFDLTNGIPSEDTLNRLIRRVKTKELESCFKSCLQAISLVDKHLSIDGKELRGTIPSGKKHALVRLVNVWSDELRLSFGQLEVDKKSNEITAIAALIDLIDCAGSVVSIDAIGCQKEIVAKIREEKAEYVIALKANQGTLYEQATDFMEKRKAVLPASTSMDKAHDRGEKRTIYVANDIQLVEQAQEWKDLQSLVMVERIRLVGEKIETNTQLYISSLAHKTPSEYEPYTRGHWGIENHLHWQLDFTFREDDNRVKKDNGPANLHLIRKWALHLLQKDEEKISLKRKRKKANRDNQYLLKILKT